LGRLACILNAYAVAILTSWTGRADWKLSRSN